MCGSEKNPLVTVNSSVGFSRRRPEHGFLSEPQTSRERLFTWVPRITRERDYLHGVRANLPLLYSSVFIISMGLTFLICIYLNIQIFICMLVMISWQLQSCRESVPVVHVPGPCYHPLGCRHFPQSALSVISRQNNYIKRLSMRN